LAERINVYLPDDLHRALEAHREHLNVSRICQDALAREVARLESLQQVGGPLPQLRAEERGAIASRLRAERERRRAFWYELGYRSAFDWACRRADADALEALAAGRALEAQAVPGWVEGMKFAKAPDAAAAQAWWGLHDAAREAAARVAEAPPEDLGAFNRGVRDGANAVWDSVADEVRGGEAGVAGADAMPGRAPGTDPPGPVGPAAADMRHPGPLPRAFRPLP